MKGTSIVLFGAGRVCSDYLSQLKDNKHCSVTAIVDNDYKNIRNLSNIDVISPESLQQMSEYNYVVIASYRFNDSIFTDLANLEIPENKIITAFRKGVTSLSAHGEDLIVYTIFSVFGKKTFSYIDIGANDPYNVNNTVYLYYNGCRGILVEANPDLIDRMKKYRAEDLIVNVGVGTEHGTFPYYMYKNSRYNTFSKKVVQYHKNAGTNFVEVRQVPVIPLNELIQKYANGIWPDFLKIDIEGWDYDVLSASDFSTNGPIVICAENTNLDEMDSMLSKKGYLLFMRTLSNSIYIQRKFYTEIKPERGL